MKLELPDIDVTYFTVRLSNGMMVTIVDGDTPSITVKQKARDLLNGAPSDPDFPRYDMGGEYEFDLPDASAIAELCDERNHDTSDPFFPSEGHATITVTHRH